MANATTSYSLAGYTVNETTTTRNNTMAKTYRSNEMGSKKAKVRNAGRVRRFRKKVAMK